MIFLYLINEYIFWYPLVMSIIWIIGGIYFFIRNETDDFGTFSEYPMVSILIPSYNEEYTIEKTINDLSDLNYPNYEIIVLNHGSKDKTVEIVKNILTQNKKLKLINIKNNNGKANALYYGLVASKGEILICIDADSSLDNNAINYLVNHFIGAGNERVGAVTGNPRVKNRSSLLAKIQVCEFASIIGLIKRTQRLLGKVMTVSGVVVAYRKSALMDCGLWDRDTITEDIGVTWKLQKRFWAVRYEPKALCWMLVPETIKGYWNQRVRWAQGGVEAIIKHRDILLSWKQRRLIPIYLEQLASIIWALAWMITTMLQVVISIYYKKPTLPIRWHGTYLALVCIIQFFIAMVIEEKYEKGISKYYIWAIWYPIFFWYFNALVVAFSIPKAIKAKLSKKKFATWDSPDRGL